MEEILRRRRVLESDLATAIETGTQLAVHYQPVYSAIDGRMSSMEALCRWMHPTFGAISPDVFVPIAEECGLIQKLGLYVLEEACSLLADVPDCDVGISVNASAIELMAPGYAPRVLTILSKYSVDPSRLEIEITERVATDTEGKATVAISHCGCRRQVRHRRFRNWDFLVRAAPQSECRSHQDRQNVR